jgi:hypothetical protein
MSEEILDTPEAIQAQLDAEADRVVGNAAHWLDSQGTRDLEAGISVDEFEALKSLIGNKAFGIFWSLLRNARTQWGQVLINAPLGAPEKDAAAAVIQGHMRAFDQLRSLLLQIADPRSSAAEESR